MTDAKPLIDDMRQLLAGFPLYMAGSLLTSYTYDKPGTFSDVDVWAPTPEAVVAGGMRLIDNDYTLDDRFARVWSRWIKMGINSFHTNSLRLFSPQGVEVNLIFKRTEGHAVTSLAQVLESFDFGFLATGWDLETDRYMDMRGYLFPGPQGQAPTNQQALPMMPNKRSNWRAGFISQYNGMREVGRYVKYVDYGYDMSMIKDDLATGYEQATLYYEQHPDKEKQLLGQIYSTIAAYIRIDEFDQLRQFAKEIEYSDALDVIMGKLE